MAWHHRRVKAGSLPRVSVRFEREDRLWQSPQTVFHPNLKKDLSFPCRLSNGEILGPNLLDMIDHTEEVQETTVGGKRKACTIHRLCLRAPSSLFCKPDPAAYQDLKGPARDDARLRAALHKGWIAKGTQTGAFPGYIAIKKYSSVTISRIVFVQCAGMRGGITEAVQYIQAKAAQAWAADIARSTALFERVAQAPNGILVDDLPDTLFPDSTISQQVESEILREVCTWLGVDPDMSVDRPMGRPSVKQAGDGGETDAGEVIELRLSVDHRLSGQLIRTFAGLAEGTRLESLTVLALAELLGELRHAHLEHDADLLEAYLDAEHENWHDIVAEAISDPRATHSGAPDPYDVLGLQRGCTVDEVKKAFRRVMQGVHEDKSGSRYLAQLVNEARVRILEEIQP